ncbi:MAG: hypothetical protein IJO61_03745 [Oscillospiraceae bacterium]|nr:hypothetical protein [Oscillospiraceae bacterium]
MRNVLKLASCIFAIPILFGCSDYSELNMQKLVNGAGIDKKDDEIYVSIVSPTLSEEKEREIIKTSGKSFFDAVRNAASISDKKLYWGHATVLVMGENLLSEMDTLLDSILRARDVYPDIALVVAKGTDAEAVLNAGEGDVTESIYNMFANEENSKRFQALRIWELFREREEFGVCVIPTVSIEKGEIFLSGGAVINGGKPSGYLSGEEVLIRSLVTDKGAGGYLPMLSGEKGEVSFEILAREGKKKETETGNEISLRITLSPAEVRGEMSGEEMKKLGEKYIKEETKKLLERASRENMGDIFALGKSADYNNTEVFCEVRISDILGGEK